MKSAIFQGSGIKRNHRAEPVIGIYPAEEIDSNKLGEIVDNIRHTYRHFGYEIHVSEWGLTDGVTWTEEDFDYFRKKGFKVERFPQKGEES